MFYQPPADSFSNWSQLFWGIPQPIKGWSWQLQDYLLKPRGAGKQRRCECWLVKRWSCSVCWDFAHLQHQTGIQVKIKALFVKKYHLLLSSCSCHVVSTVKLNLHAGTAIKAVEKYTKILALCLVLRPRQAEGARAKSVQSNKLGDNKKQLQEDLNEEDNTMWENQS